MDIVVSSTQLFQEYFCPSVVWSDPNLDDSLVPEMAGIYRMEKSRAALEWTWK